MESSISKEQISSLEIEEFPGRIIVVQSPGEVDDAISYLSKFLTLGFDTETRPAFKKGNLNNVALIQLSNEDQCYLFRLNLIGFPKPLVDLLCNPDIKKIGISLRDDFLSLRRRTKITPQGFEDLQSIVPQHGITDSSLQKIYALLFEKKISKGQRLSNWEAEILSEAQQKYAALDAWACLKIYNELCHTQKYI